MKDTSPHLTSPIAKVHGLGSAKDGTGHFINQRLTAIANVPLVLWFIWSVSTNDFTSYDVASAWLAQPLNAILMSLLVLSTFIHAVLGGQVVVEDYIHNEGFKLFKLISQRLIYIALAAVCIFSILKVAL